jgi:hypothetical protein
LPNVSTNIYSHITDLLFDAMHRASVRRRQRQQRSIRTNGLEGTAVPGANGIIPVIPLLLLGDAFVVSKPDNRGFLSTRHGRALSLGIPCR